MSCFRVLRNMKHTKYKPARAVLFKIVFLLRRIGELQDGVI